MVLWLMNEDNAESVGYGKRMEEIGDQESVR
jgi:hypothetical protein